MAIPAEIQALATKVRNEVYGRDVREAIAKSIEETGKTAAEAYEITQNLIDGTFDEGILSTQIEQKLLNLEAQYAPQLTSLTAELAETNKFAGQVDFVDLIMNRTSYEVVSVKKITSPYLALSVFCSNGNEHVTHEWRKNANDDYWIYHVGFHGLLTTFPSDRKSTTSKTETWSAIDGSGNTFTTIIGATFTVTITGEQITFNHLADNRGGIFSIVIDGDAENPILVSVYSATTVVKNQIIAKGLSNTTHTVVGTFIGADPDNPPSGTARGWIRDDQTSPVSNDRYTMIGGVPYNGVYNTPTNKMLLAYASNKGWAFNITCEGKTNWFPEHNGVGTAFDLAPKKIILDGKELNFEDMEVEKVYRGENFQLVQKVACRFPDVVGDIAELEVTYGVSRSGVVPMGGYLKALKPFVINNGYVGMLPLEQTVIDEFVSGIGTHVINAGDSSNLNLPNDKDQTFSFAGVDSVNKDYIAAVSIDFPLKTLRYGKSGRGNPLYFINQRPQYPKLYPLVFFNHSMVVGEKYNFNARFAIADIPNIYNAVL